MYDLEVPRDEREVVSLGNAAVEVTPEVAAERERLHQRLIQVMDSLGTTPMGVVWPEHWGEGAPKISDPQNLPSIEGVLPDKLPTV